MTQDTLTIALWQTPYASTPSDALARLEHALMRARQQGAELLLCPEMGLTGYAIGADRVRLLAESVDGPRALAVAAMAKRHQMAVVVGMPLQPPDGGLPWNSALAFGPDGGRLASYRKTHLFGALDHAQFRPGDHSSTFFAWRGWRLGLLICYDVEFPEAVRLLALQGVDAVLVPTANMQGFDEVPKLLVPARACENRVYVAYANACSDEGAVRYGGLSTVAGPDGTALVTAGRDEAILLTTLKRQALQAAADGSQLPHRRADLYGPLVSEPQDQALRPG